MVRTEEGVRETRGGVVHCPMCGGSAMPGMACPTCGFNPPARRRPDPGREPGRKLWIALAIALLSLLLSFCLLYALVRTIRVG
jgi:ribosomal protein L32